MILMKKILILFALIAFLSASAFAGNLTVESAYYTPNPAEPGKTFDLTLNIKNDGLDTSTNTKVYVETESPFFFGTNEKATNSYGTISSYQNFLATFTVSTEKTALDGIYELKIHLIDSKSNSDKIVPVSINVLARKPQIELIESSLTEVNLGQTQELKLKVKNIGSSKAINVLVGFDEDRTVTSTGVIVERNIISLGSTRALIDELNVNEEKEISLKIAVNSSSELKAYNLPVKIIFRDENRAEYSLTRYIGLNVVQKPELDLTVNEIKPKFYPGSSNDLIIDIFNSGLANAKNIVVKVESEIFEEIDLEKVFIGSLDSDDFDSFTVKPILKKTIEPGTYIVKVSTYFKSENGNQIQLVKEFNVKVYSASEISGNGNAFGWVLPLIVIIIIVIVGFWFFKLRKKAKHSK